MKAMKIFSTIIFFIFILGVIDIAYADNAEFRTVVTRNDNSVGGEFHLDLQIRITSGTSPRTLNSMTVDIIYGTQLTEWSTNPATGWAFGLADGYSRSASKNAGYYRVLVTDAGVNQDGGGVPPGWDVTTSWQTIVTLQWTINATTSVQINIDDGTDAAAYFDNYQNEPSGGATNWNVSNIDLGDVSLPVQMSLFTAETSKEHGVVISWHTESEVNTTGFDIYRSETDKSSYQKINPAMIPGQGNSSSGYDYSYADRHVRDGVVYWYKVIEIATDGSQHEYGPIRAQGINTVPEDFSLSHSYPNPFNPETTFKYQLAEDSRVTINVYNLMGKRIKQLVREDKPAGYYTETWKGMDENGQRVSSGIYLIYLQAGSFSMTRKITLIR